MVQMPTSDRLAQLLFGRELRLAVARWAVAHPTGRFYQSEVTAAMPHRLRTAVPSELIRLVEAGMLEEEDPGAGQRRRYYTRVDTDLWKIFEISDQVFQALEAAR